MMTALAIAVDLILVFLLVFGMANIGKILGPKPVHEGDGNLPYETGMRPFGYAAERMAVLYYRFAVLFVVFDVEAAFLFPWAVGGRGAGRAEIAAISAFVGLLGLMLAYFWRKGALECL